MFFYSFRSKTTTNENKLNYRRNVAFRNGLHSSKFDCSYLKVGGGGGGREERENQNKIKDHKQN